MATINVQEFATELNTDARTARKFLRSVTPKEEQPGKGSRWSIEKNKLRGLKKEFAAYEEKLRARAEEPADEVEAE